MAEYISKTKFEELMRKKARSNFDLYYADKSKHYHDNAIGYSIAADEAHVFPSTDVQPVKRGKWDFIGHQLFKCTNCTKIYTQKQLEDIGENWAFPDFCPKCGADMKNDSNFKETEGKVLAVGLGSSFKDSLIKTEVEGLFLNFEQEE